MINENMLIKKVLNGDNRAFEKLICKYDQKILSLLLAILKNRDDANDAYQTAFIKVYQNLNKFKQNSSFYTWIYRIAINTAYTYFGTRQKKNEKIINEDFSNMENIFICDEEEGNYDEFHKIIKNEVEKLSFQQKTVVFLKSYEGKKFREIASILSLNIGTVKKYFHRAVQNIKSNVKDIDREM